MDTHRKNLKEAMDEFMASWEKFLMAEDDTKAVTKHILKLMDTVDSAINKGPREPPESS